MSEVAGGRSRMVILDCSMPCSAASNEEFRRIARRQFEAEARQRGLRLVGEIIVTRCSTGTRGSQWRATILAEDARVPDTHDEWRELNREWCDAAA